MDIERLTKSQIVMLTLLVSFVTSIATGIVTVSLMDQAPQVIPQTINRVVERTVEKVVPQETQTATVITKEKTVTVKESDLIAQAVARARTSVVRVHVDEGENVAGAFLTRGVVVAKGYVVVDGDGIAIGKTYLLSAAEKNFSSKAVVVDAGHNLALLEFKDEKAFEPATFGTGAVVLGQTLVGISGGTSLKVANGIVTSVSDGDGTTQDSFEVNIEDALLVSGSVLVNTDGAIAGLYTGSTKRIVPANVLIALMKSLTSNSGGSATSTDTKGS